MKKIGKLAGATAVSVVFSLTGAWCAANAQSNLSDIGTHWAKTQLTEWNESGYINGYADGTFKPDQTITRAEFIALINKSFGFSEPGAVAFDDVRNTAWFYTQVAAAVKAGYISGYADNTLRPNNPISREEAAVIVSRLMELGKTDNAEARAFGDAGDIASWSLDAIGSLVKLKLLSGYPDGQFMPDKPLTRAEAVTLLNHAIKLTLDEYNLAGTFGPPIGVTTLAGDVVINAPGVTLQNTIIEGNLLFAAGIGEGDAFLNNVTVKGTTTVAGGGANSIHIDDSTLFKVVVNKESGTVRIVAGGTTSVDEVTVNSPATIEESGDEGTGFSDILLTEELKDELITLIGVFNNLNVSSTGATVKVQSGSVENVTVEDNATGVKFDINETANIVKMTLNRIAEILGLGKIETLVLTANSVGTTYANTPGEIIQPNASNGSNNSSNYALVSGITVSSANDVIWVADNGTLQLSAAILPVYAINQSVIWSVDPGTGTATISNSGLLSGGTIGTVTVRASAKDSSGVYGTKVIHVVDSFVASVNAATKENLLAVLNGNTDLVYSPTIIGGSRQQSVSNYVYDTKLVKENDIYTTVEQIEAAFEQGDAYESAKWTVSNALETDTAVAADFEGLEAAYKAHGIFRGEIDADGNLLENADPILVKAYSALQSFNELESGDQAALITAVQATSSTDLNKFKINDVYVFLMIKAIDNAESSDKALVEKLLEKNAVMFSLPTTDADGYANEDFNLRNRQASVAQYVIDSKGVYDGYSTVEEILEAFNGGLAYEQAKLAFSTKLKTGSVVMADVEALQTAYIAHGQYRDYLDPSDQLLIGVTDTVYVNAYNALDDLVNAGDSDQTNVLLDINTKFDLNGADDFIEGTHLFNPYKINSVFEEISDYFTVD